MKREKMPMMTCLEAHAFTMGKFTSGGKYYVLISQPYVYTVKDEEPHYIAEAVCADDEMDEGGFRPVYSVCWRVRDEEQVRYCRAMMAHDYETMNEITLETGINEDTVDLEWDNPYAIGLTDYKYDVESFSKRYSWD